MSAEDEEVKRVEFVAGLAEEVLASRKKLHAIGVQLKIWEADPDKNCYHDRVLRAILDGGEPPPIADSGWPRGMDPWPGMEFEEESP